MTKAETFLIRLWWAAILATLLGLLILSWPYIVSAYHMEQAGQALDSTPPNPPQAISNVEQAIRLTPNEAHAHRLLGRTYLAQGNAEAAIEALTTYTGLRPDDPGGHWEVALLYESLWRARQDDTMKQAMLREWTMAGVTIPQFLVQGQQAQELGQYEAAELWYERALILEPDLGQAWFGKAWAQQEQGKRDQASEHFEFAFQLEPALIPEIVLPEKSGQLLNLENFEGLNGYTAFITELPEGKAIALVSNHTVKTKILVYEEGLYELRMLAVNGQPGPIELEIGLDKKPVKVLSYEKNDWSWEEQRFSVTLPLGLHEFSISFINDEFIEPDLDRNALVAGIKIHSSNEDLNFE